MDGFGVFIVYFIIPHFANLCRLSVIILGETEQYSANSSVVQLNRTPLLLVIEFIESQAKSSILR